MSEMTDIDRGLATVESICGTRTVNTADLLRVIGQLAADVEQSNTIAQFWRACTRSATRPKNPHAITLDFDTVDAAMFRLGRVDHDDD